MSADLEMPSSAPAAEVVAEPPTQKRKASSSPPPDEETAPKSPKRTRLEETNGHHTAKPNVPEAVRESPKKQQQDTSRRKALSREEERKRGKRLFGGLLSTLSQTTTSSQQKRRQEVERRQQAKATQQKVEDKQQREEKLAKLAAVRKAEQIKFEERVMETRHAHMLETARFLQTKTEPKIFYLPWDTTKSQEDSIKDQIRNAEDLIAEEVREFRHSKEQRLKALGLPTKPPKKTEEPDKPVGKIDTESLPNPPPTESTNTPSSTHANKVGHEKEPDEAGDVMVEDEDTVLY